MMKWILGLILGIAVPSYAHAQYSFNKRFDTFGQSLNQDGWAVEQSTDGGYFVIHMSYLLDSALQYLVTSILILDEQGHLDTVTRVPLGSSSIYCGWANSSHRTVNGGIVIGGSATEPDNTRKAMLIWFGPDGYYESMISYYPSEGYWIGRQAKQATDGGFVLVGELYSNENNDGFLIKTDANGEQEWVQTYGGAFNDYLVAVDLDGAGGYYLGGEYRVSASNLNFWVKRVDADGTTIWDRRWGSAFDEPNAHLTVAADGHILVASGWSYSSNFGSVKLYMAKLNSANGQPLWERRYGPSLNSTSFFVVQEVTPSGDLIAAGASRQNAQLAGVMLRTTSMGDSLWMRYYQFHDDEIASGTGLLRDVQPTPDGGFIAVGAAFGVSNPVNPPGYGQDVWVIKTDSMGCLEPGCDLITGVETQITNLREALTVYPNPVARGGAVQVKVELPEHFEAQGQLRLSVSDAAGRLVHEQKVGPGVSSLDLALATGLYHLHLSDATRWISGAKLVVE